MRSTNGCEGCSRDQHKRVWESGPDNAFWDFGYPRNAGAEFWMTCAARSYCSR